MADGVNIPNTRRKGRLTLALVALTLAFAAVPAVIFAWTSSTEIRFVEQTDRVGLTHTHHTRLFPGKTGDVLHVFTSGGASVAIGDYDNDGFDDVFVTDSDIGRKCRLFHNNGNLTF